MTRSLVILSLLVSASGCGSRELKIDINPTYSDIQRIVLSQKCTQCHTSLLTYAGVRRIVEPGKPDESDLYTEVADGGMPMQSAPLSDKEITAIRDWIISGAAEFPSPSPN